MWLNRIDMKKTKSIKCLILFALLGLVNIVLFSQISTASLIKYWPFNNNANNASGNNRAITKTEDAQLFDSYYDPNYFDKQIIIENMVVQPACNGNDGSVQVFVNQANGPFQYALDQPTNFQNSNLLENIGEGLHRIYSKSECGLKDTIVDFSCLDISFPDNIDSANCVFFPTATEWGIGQPIVSELAAAMCAAVPLVGDIDDDGQQEIVMHTDSKVLIFKSNTELKNQFNVCLSRMEGQLGIAKVQYTPNEYKTIIVAYSTNNHYFYAYDALGNQLWQSNQPFSSHNSERFQMPAISFADFNHDGWAEMYAGSEIYDAATGVFLGKTNGNKGHAGRTWESYSTYQSSAADMFGDNVLELAVGNTLYSVDIQSRTDVSLNHVSLLRHLESSDMVMADGSIIPFTDGNTYLADFNLDGLLDVLVMNENDSNREVYIYVWDVASQSILCSKKITNARKFGMPQIGDLDGDGYPEICFIVGTYYDHQPGDNETIIALKYNEQNPTGEMDVFWTTSHADFSGATSLTLFDFNQDGYSELVYRDEHHLRIINGSLFNHQTGSPVSSPYNLATYPCGSGTALEYPIVCDVDLDGEAEIIVGSSCDNTSHYGHLYIFKSGGFPWASARKVWNQYMYNVTNVNKDLSIPQYQFNNATSFTAPDGVVRRPFNNFLQQATTIDQYGRPFYSVPDAVALSADINTNSNNTTITLTYTNQGDNTLNAPYYITVFANQVGGAIIQSFTIDEPLLVGNIVQQSLSFSSSNLCQTPDLNSIVIAINCTGGGIAQDGNLQPECDITNNVAQITLNQQSEPTHVSVTACDHYVWYDQTFTESGQYETTVQNIYGCDSTLILDLAINNSYRYEDVASGCNSYFWPVNQQWYYESTSDSVVVQGQQDSCDSTFVLYLTMSAGTSSTIHGSTSVFYATDIVTGVYTYYLDSTDIHPENVHWAIDRDEWVLMPHGASCHLLCTSEGQGILRAWTEGEDCALDTTLVLNATFFDVGENGQTPLKLYPNPTKGKFTVEWQDILVINVYDLNGQKMLACEFDKEEQICAMDVSHLQNNLYFLEIISYTGRVIRPIVLEAV